MTSLSIHIKKGDNRQSTISVIRRDGTKTYSKIPDDFEVHDIAHYVVEKQLEFSNSFYGLLAQGHQIQDFQLSKEKRPDTLWPQNIPKEALTTEHLVNLVTIDFMGSRGQMDVLENLRAILKENNLVYPKELNREKLESIRKELFELMEKWNTLGNGEKLVLQLALK